MKELIIISPSSVYGGGESYIITLVEVLTTRNLRVLCLNDMLYDKLTSLGAKCELFKSKKDLFLRLVKYAFSPNKKLVFNGLPESRLFAALFIMKGFLLITHSSESWGQGNDRSLRDKLRTRINKFVYDKKSTSIIAVCEYAKLNLSSNFKKANVYKIYNTGDISGITFRENERDFTFGFMGRLCTEKGIDSLIEMLRILDSSKSNCNLKFVIAGDGPKQKNIEDLINELTTISVSYVGFTAPEVFFSQIDCYILPSLTEGCPIAIIEAMSVGIPTIATNVGGVSELITHKENGFLFEPLDVKAMSDCILEIASNKSIISEFKVNCLNAHRLNFSKEIFSNSYNGLISKKLL